MGEGNEEREGGTNGRKRDNDREKIKRNYMEQNTLNVLCVCACVRVCVHACVHACMRVSVYMCACTCVCMCACVCMRACIYIYIYMCVCVRVLLAAVHLVVPLGFAQSLGELLHLLALLPGPLPGVSQQLGQVDLGGEPVPLRHHHHHHHHHVTFTFRAFSRRFYPKLLALVYLS